MRTLLGLVALLISNGCGIVGPSCLERQQRGTLPPISGTVDAGQLAMHLVAYDTRGSQNDARLSWPGQGTADGAQLSIYATRATCEAFTLPAESNSGACAILGRAGWTPVGIATSLGLTHGRGNPEVLGSPPEYKLWLVSDRPTSYTVTVHWFYGPDC